MYAFYLDERIRCFKDLKHDFVRMQTESNRRSDGAGANCELIFPIRGGVQPADTESCKRVTSGERELVVWDRFRHGNMDALGLLTLGAPRSSGLKRGGPGGQSGEVYG